MRVNLYTVRDKVAKESGPLFQATNDGVAKRQFRALLADKGLVKDEFQLLRVGQYDTINTVIVAGDSDDLVCEGTDGSVK